MKHFTIIEIGADSESPMIGTINDVDNSVRGIDTFICRLLDALVEHFDVTGISINKTPDLFDGSPYWDLIAEVGESEWNIRVLETWIY